MHGTLDRLVVESELLADNPLGDPARRPLYVYRPPGRRARPPARAAVRLRDPGLHGPARHVVHPRPVLADADRGATTRCSPPATARPRSSCSSTPGRATAARSSSTRARPGATWTTCATRSSTFVDARYPTAADRDHRGLAGKSSGGYGAMVVPMLRPDVLRRARLARRRRAVRGRLPAGVPGLRAHAPRPLRRLDRRLLRGLRRRRPLRHGRASARSSSTATRPPTRPTRASRARRCCRSTSRRAGWSTTCGRSGSRRTRSGWRPRTPTRCARCTAIYLDAGTRDEYFLDLGALAFGAELDKLGVRAHARAVRRPPRRHQLALPGRDPRARARADVTRTLDITGLTCPMTWVKTKLELERLAPGDVLTVALRARARRSRTCRARRARPATTWRSTGTTVRIVRR